MLTTKKLLSHLNNITYNTNIKIFHENKIYNNFSVLYENNCFVISTKDSKKTYTVFELKEILNSINKDLVIDFSFPGESTQLPDNLDLLIVSYLNSHLILV